MIERYVLMPEEPTEEMLGGPNANPRAVMTGQIAYAHFLAHRPEVPEEVVERLEKVLAAKLRVGSVYHSNVTTGPVVVGIDDAARAVIAALKARI